MSEVDVNGRGVDEHDTGHWGKLVDENRDAIVDIGYRILILWMLRTPDQVRLFNRSRSGCPDL